MARSSLPLRSRSRRFGIMLGALGLAAALTTGTAATASATPVAEVAPVAVAAEVAAARGAGTAAPVSVNELAMTGSTTTITVRRVYRRGQVQWINHVINTRLLGLDGCQATRTKARWDGKTYRTTVRTVCTDGPARAEAAAASLRRDRPWYLMSTNRVSLVGFGLLANLSVGNDRAVPAALAALPNGPFTFADGDDLSLNYVGQGVTQAELDAAVAAFAKALGIPVGAVEVTPLTT